MELPTGNPFFWFKPASWALEIAKIFWLWAFPGPFLAPLPNPSPFSKAGLELADPSHCSLSCLCDDRSDTFFARRGRRVRGRWLDQMTGGRSICCTLFLGHQEFHPYPLVMTNSLLLNMVTWPSRNSGFTHFHSMVIFYSYVSLPEGNQVANIWLIRLSSALASIDDDDQWIDFRKKMFDSNHCKLSLNQFWDMRIPLGETCPINQPTLPSISPK